MRFKLWLESVENDDLNLKSGMSRGEIALGTILFNMFGSYNVQYEFKGCVNQRCLPFDASFLITNIRYVVEYHGRQHYEFTTRFHKNQTIFKAQILRDKIKYNFCKENNIPLLVIPYWEINRMQPIIEDFVTSEGFQERFANPPVPENKKDQREKVMNDETIQLNPHAAEELRILKQERNEQMIKNLADFYRIYNKYPSSFNNQQNRSQGDDEDKLFYWLATRRKVHAGNINQSGIKYPGEEELGTLLGLPHGWLGSQIATEEDNKEMIIRLTKLYKDKKRKNPSNSPYPQTFNNQKDRYKGDEEDELAIWLEYRRTVYEKNIIDSQYPDEEQFGIDQGLPTDWLKRQRKGEEFNNEMIKKLAQFVKNKQEELKKTGEKKSIYPQKFNKNLESHKIANRHARDEEDILANWLNGKRLLYRGTGKQKGVNYEGEEQFGIDQGLPTNWLIRTTESPGETLPLSP